jgi:uncharacterized protein (DUF1697 family)
MRYVALLRAIANVSMAPFREAMEEMGFSGVESLGMSGNLLFEAGDADVAAMEARIGDRFRTTAIVRSRIALKRGAGQNPFGRRDGACVLFLAKAPAVARRRAFEAIGFEDPSPVLVGRTVFFVHPTRLVGKRSPCDFERALDLRGTARSARIVEQLVERLGRAGQ